MNTENNIDITAENKLIVNEYKSLLKSLKYKLKKGDKELIKQAFKMAIEAHKNMRRKSGEPYILHPIAVANICVQEIGLGVRSTICALLHDTVEDTELTIEDIKREFNNEIALIVEGLTKLSVVADIDSGEELENFYEQNALKSNQAKNFKKILLALMEDPRVILIKLADRLHNMRTLDSLKKEKQLKIAAETLYIYAPIAHRLGLNAIKTELEDLSLKFREPAIYKEIAQKLLDTKRERNRFINDFIKPIKDKLNLHGFKNFEIYGRPKSIFSIWNKMKTKNVSFEEIYDLFAIRIILEDNKNKQKEVLECFKVYSIILSEYSSEASRVRDWLNKPKSNGYEALHLTVMSREGKWVEIQIKTQRMNTIAEKGLAAHFKYKATESSNLEDKFDNWFTQIKDALSDPDSDNIEFLQNIKSTLLVDEIYVYTPKGQIKNLPRNSTVLDFAFTVHSDVGLTCISAKVNHKLVPINHILKNGDQIEIITSNKQTPQLEWLNFVVSSKAKTLISNYFKEINRKKILEGEYILMEKFKELDLRYYQHNLDELIKYFELETYQELYLAVSSKKIDIQKIKTIPTEHNKLIYTNYLKEKSIIENIKSSQTSENANKIQLKEFSFEGKKTDKIKYQLAKCCNPIYGDDVFGLNLENKKIMIHQTNCKNSAELLSIYGDKIVKIKWVSNDEISFLIGIQIKGVDAVGLIHKIADIISKELQLNIAAFSLRSTDGLFDGNIEVFVKNKNEFNTLIEKLKSITEIHTIERVNIKISN